MSGPTAEYLHIVILLRNDSVEDQDTYSTAMCSHP